VVTPVSAQFLTASQRVHRSNIVDPERRNIDGMVLRSNHSKDREDHDKPLSEHNENENETEDDDSSDPVVKMASV